MKPADYKCLNCNFVKEYFFNDTQQIPRYINGCEKCDGVLKRIFTPIYSICHQGKAGNSNNGYTSSPVSIKKT